MTAPKNAMDWIKIIRELGSFGALLFILYRNQVNNDALIPVLQKVQISLEAIQQNQQSILVMLNAAGAH